MSDILSSNHYSLNKKVDIEEGGPAQNADLTIQED